MHDRHGGQVGRASDLISYRRDQLCELWPALWDFASKLDGPLTNSEAERSIRRIVFKRKIARRIRSEHGDEEIACASSLPFSFAESGEYVLHQLPPRRFCTENVDTGLSAGSLINRGLNVVQRCVCKSSIEADV